MQILFLTRNETFLLILVLWPIIQAVNAYICHKIKDEKFSFELFPFKPFQWEKRGTVYNQFLKVHCWKKYLPDGAAFVKGELKMRHLDFSSDQNIVRFLTASCRGESSHWLSIFSFWVFGIFIPPIGVFYMFIYTLTANLPCIIVQRYNRPRITKLIENQKNIQERIPNKKQRWI